MPKPKPSNWLNLAEVKLGKPTYISEGTIYPPVVYKDAADGQYRHQRQPPSAPGR